MSTLLLDTHVVYWWAAQPQLVSAAAAQALSIADELAVASITWYELAWMAEHGRIDPGMPLRSWLEGLAGQVRTVVITPAIAARATTLPATFPGDAADRIIVATGIEHGWSIVSKDRLIRSHVEMTPGVIW